VIVDAQKGYVLTANHVVAQASLLQIKTKDGRKFAAMLVGRDAPTDVALLIATGHVERGRIDVYWRIWTRLPAVTSRALASRRLALLPGRARGCPQGRHHPEG
jgi:S1-C subfamily serine protease